jgi:hypothetical protein
MAIRIDEVKKIIKKLNKIYNDTDISIFSMDDSQQDKLKNEIHKLHTILKEKYLIYYNQNIDINIDDLIILDEHFINDTSGLNELLPSDYKVPSYYYNKTYNEEVIISQGIFQDDNDYIINKITSNFKRNIYDANQIDVPLNIFLPEEELIEHIKFLKKNEKKIKSPNKLLDKNIQESKKVKNYPKKQTAIKLADMFFVYDYVTALLKEDEYCNNLMLNEYIENKNRVKKSKSYTIDEKKEQYKTLLEEYEDNKVVTKIQNIFKDFDEKIDNINFKSSTAAKYYYAIKPYIEDHKYPELLTGESVIE